MDLEDARTKADELGEMAKSSERRAKDLEAQNAGKDVLSFKAKSERHFSTNYNT